jgi:hypothetical protein
MRFAHEKADAFGAQRRNRLYCDNRKPAPPRTASTSMFCPPSRHTRVLHDVAFGLALLLGRDVLPGAAAAGMARVWGRNCGQRGVTRNGAGVSISVMKPRENEAFLSLISTRAQSPRAAKRRENGLAVSHLCPPASPAHRKTMKGQCEPKNFRS